MIPSVDVKFFESILQDFQVRSNELESLASNIRNLLENLQSQPKFTISSLKATIKSHAEALFALAENLASFHEDVQELRNQYRHFCLVYRHDSRDPFAKPVYFEHQTQAQPSSTQPQLAAPKLNTFVAQQQPQQSSLFGAAKPTATYGGFNLPSSNALFK